MTVTGMTLTLITILVYFMWMDVALYINVQQVQPQRLGETDKTSDWNQINASNYVYSPFRPMTQKLLFQGPTIHYIDTPLAFWTVSHTDVAFAISPNSISIIAVVFAGMAARMFMSDSLRYRQMGVLLFKIRDYLDSLDGCVARARRNQVAITMEAGTLGYYFDGVCDGMGDTMVFLALVNYIYRNHASSLIRPFSFNYLRLDSTSTSSPSKIPASKVKDLLPTAVVAKVTDFRATSAITRVLPSFWLVFCVAMQALLASSLWNYSVLTFSDLLDSDSYISTTGLNGPSEEKLLEQNQILKSSTYWMIVYFWRLANPHSVMQFILVALLYNKVFEYISAVQYLGYVPIAFTGFMSYVYSKYAIELLEK